MTKRFVIRGLMVFAVMAYSILSAGTASAQFVLIRTVNTTADTVAPNACATGNPCSLRAAMSGITADIEIRFQISASDPFCTAGVCTINIGSNLPAISGTNIFIAGPGADRLIIRPNTGVGGTPIFVVTHTSGSVFISGLTARDAFTSLGAIRNIGTGTLVLTDVVVTSNTAGVGGAIRALNGTVNVIRSSIFSNTATADGGGGIDVDAGATCNVVNSLIVSNTSTAGGGGGIRTEGTTRISNSTIVGNTAASSGSGGGVFRVGGTVTVKSSIIAQNTAATGPDFFGSVTTAGFNLVGKTDGSTGFTQSTDLRGTIAAPLDPKVDPTGIQMNGGRLPTLGLSIDSPAVDKGSSSGLTGVLTTDQRSGPFARTRDNPLVANAVGGTGTDIGAYERHTYSSFDFDGDGRTGVGIFRPSSGEWWINSSLSGSTSAAQFGASTDRITPADFTGDGKTDIAFWRPASGEWFVLRSEDSSFFSFPFGSNGDVPAPADFDGDNKADPAVFRPSTGTWFIQRSTAGVFVGGFGANGDIPVAADYDGDGRADIAIYRPSNGQWWLNRSTSGVIALTFGTSSDKPVQGDYTGDDKSDIAFYRPSTGEWYVLRSNDFSYYSVFFGTTGDIPAPGDYDGDGKFDTTVFRPSNSTWYSQRSTAGTLIQQFGANGDRPLANAFVP